MLGEFKPQEPKGLERKFGLSTEQFLVSACVESSKNLKDLKEILCDLAIEEEEVRDAWAALAMAPGAGVVVQAYPVGQVVRPSGPDIPL